MGMIFQKRSGVLLIKSIFKIRPGLKEESDFEQDNIRRRPASGAEQENFKSNYATASVFYSTIPPWGV